MSAAPQAPTVLYITGWTRSGSTLLGNVLGELPGVLHVGELHYVWQNGVLDQGSNSLCGCGLPVTGCEHWGPILKSTEQDSRSVAEAQVFAQRNLLRTRHTTARLAEARGQRPPAPGLEAALGRTLRLYRELTRQGAERLIVDSSKFPAEAAALLGRDDVRTRVLHIVRDPRATAVSYLRAKDYIDPMRPSRSSAFWSAFNLASEAVGQVAGERYLRIRHEDLCRHPHETVAQVMRFAGLADPCPVDEAGNVTLSTNHTVTGNPDRLANGPTAIAAKGDWSRQLSNAQQWAATLPAAPLLARYRYPLPSRA